MAANIAAKPIDARVTLIDNIALLNAILMDALDFFAFHSISLNATPASLAARRAAALAANSALPIADIIL